MIIKDILIKELKDILAVNIPDITVFETIKELNIKNRLAFSRKMKNNITENDDLILISISEDFMEYYLKKILNTENVTLPDKIDFGKELLEMFSNGYNLTGKFNKMIDYSLETLVDYHGNKSLKEVLNGLGDLIKPLEITLDNFEEDELNFSIQVQIIENYEVKEDFEYLMQDNSFLSEEEINNLLDAAENFLEKKDEEETEQLLFKHSPEESLKFDKELLELVALENKIEILYNFQGAYIKECDLKLILEKAIIKDFITIDVLMKFGDNIQNTNVQAKINSNGVVSISNII